MHRPPPLPALTSLRFFLAAAVLGHHILAWSGGPGWLLAISIPLGAGVVPVFFCLSGFVLTYAQADTPISPLAFLRARAARILPAYWLSLLVAAVLGAGHLNQHQDWPNLILVLLMIHAWQTDSAAHQWNSPSWSLSCEAAFYVLFPVLLLGMKWLTPRIAIIGSSTATVAFTVLAAQILSSHWVWHPLAGIGPFLLGIALGRAYLAGQRLPSRATLLVIAAWPLTIAAYQFDERLWLMLSGLLAGPLVLALASNQARWLARPRLLELGEASYALYIMHAPILTALAIPHGGSLPAWMAPLVTGICIITAVLVYRHVERPGRAWLAGRSRRRTLAGLATATSPPKHQGDVPTRAG